MLPSHVMANGKDASEWGSMWGNGWIMEIFPHLKISLYLILFLDELKLVRIMLTSSSPYRQSLPITSSSAALAEPSADSSCRRRALAAAWGSSSASAVAGLGSSGGGPGKCRKGGADLKKENGFIIKIIMVFIRSWEWKLCSWAWRVKNRKKIAKSHTKYSRIKAK